MVAATPLPNIPVPPPPVATFDKSVFEEPLNLDATAARSAGQQERAGKLLRLALEKNQWGPYMDLLRRSLARELKRSADFSSVQRFDPYIANPYFMRAMLQHAFALLVGDDTKRMIEDDERIRQHVIWLCESPEALQSFLRVLTPKDNLRQVLDTWSMLSADDGDALGAYRELAIACSLVLEKPKKFDWNGEDVTISAEERYRWYKTKDKAGKLATKLTTMSAWDLAWVVGVQVPEKEMEWTLDELSRKLKQKDWGRAYGMIEYDMQKAVTGKMKNPYDYYTFSEILKKGGICGDQSYFSSNTARCAGIPAVGISGDGPRGPHAWMAWLSDEGRWSFSGRFGGYPAGTVRDPRNGDKISEQRFTRLSDSHAPSPATMLKAQHLVWMHELFARLNEPEEAVYALDAAMRVSPHEAELWEKKLAAWSSKKPAVAAAQWKSFIEAMEREFRDDTEMLTVARNAKDRYVLANADASVVKNELRGDVRDLSKLKGLTSLNEIRTAHERYASTLQKANDYAGVRHVYREALDDYGREAAKFKALAKDYWNMVQAAPPAVKQSVCRDIEAAYERHIESKSGDYFDVKSQVSALNVVAECWRQSGDTARAERFEKEAAKRGKKATKDAL